MLRFTIPLVLALVASGPVSLSAQVRYKDSEGVTNWVDSIDKVPEQYRAGAVGNSTAPPRPEPPPTKEDQRARDTDTRREQPDADKSGELTGPACDAAVEALAARQGGAFTRDDVRREFGPACEQQILSTSSRATEMIRTCTDRISAGVRNMPSVSRAQLRAAGGPGCESVVDQLWNGLQEKRQ
jgi:hypothetical protein